MEKFEKGHYEDQQVRLFCDICGDEMNGSIPNIVKNYFHGTTIETIRGTWYFCKNNHKVLSFDTYPSIRQIWVKE